MVSSGDRATIGADLGCAAWLSCVAVIDQDKAWIDYGRVILVHVWRTLARRANC